MMKYFFVTIFLLGLLKAADAQVVVTIAGNGTPGYSGDNSSAIAASINNPDVIRFDHIGNKYIADEHNNVVRKISTAGIITTIAGTGTEGYSGDNGPATNAMLRRPSDVAVDDSGNIYISDGNNTIRKINNSGIIRTIAGTGAQGYSGDNGPATNAKLFDPIGVILKSDGDLIFSDNGNNCVRKISKSGIITTVAGTGASGYNGDEIQATNATFSYTGYIALSVSGEIYVGDYGNSRVRKIDAAGIVTTVAGNGMAGNSGDGGLATSAKLRSPSGVIFDQLGNMYISDRLEGVIRKVTTDGIITTVAGNDTIGFSGDGGPATSAKFNNDLYCSAIDLAGNLYIADPNNNRIRRVNYNTTAVNNISTINTAVTIYPNPTHATLTIKTTEKIGTSEILNMIDQAENVPIHYTNEKEVVLDVSSLSAGVYFIRVNGVYAGKFVKD